MCIRDRVISLAREDGCYETLTWCVLNTVCRDLYRIRERVEPDFQMSANIVAEQLNNEKLIRNMIRLAMDYDVNNQLIQMCIRDSRQEGISSF